MKSRFLITTALESTWRTDVPILFAGPWCLEDSREELWSQLDYEVVPYHWDDLDVLLRDETYCNDVYEALLVDLASVLNGCHHLQWPLRSWRIVLGPWLRRYVTILYDRYRAVQTAVDGFEITGASCAVVTDGDLVSTDSIDFSRLYKTDEWNYRLFSKIIRRCTSIKPEHRNNGSAKRPVFHLPPPESLAKGPPHDQRSMIGKIRRYCQSILKTAYRSKFLVRLTQFLSRRNKFYIFLPYLPTTWDVLKLSYRLRDVPIVPLASDWHSSSRYSRSQRKRILLRSSTSDRFQLLAEHLLPEMLPICYLEDFDRLHASSDSHGFPKSPKAIFTAAGLYYHEVFKVWTAKQVARGVRLVIGQHGGQYGTSKIIGEFVPHELAISDCYFSWGWTLPNQNITTAPSLVLINKKTGSWSEDGHIVIVTRPLNRYTGAFSTMALCGMHNDRYYSDLEDLVGELIKDGKYHVVVRPQPGEAGAEEKGISIASRMRKTFPDVAVALGETSMEQLFSASRLNICTYDGTPFLESLGLDRPCLLVCDTQIHPFSNLAEPLTNQLKEVGILHDTVGSAIQHIKTHASDISSWWYSKAVVQAKNSYRDRFARTSKDGLGELTKALKDVARS